MGPWLTRFPKQTGREISRRAFVRRRSSPSARVSIRWRSRCQRSVFRSWSINARRVRTDRVRRPRETRARCSQVFRSCARISRAQRQRLSPLIHRQPKGRRSMRVKPPAAASRGLPELNPRSRTLTSEPIVRQGDFDMLNEIACTTFQTLRTARSGE